MLRQRNTHRLLASVIACCAAFFIVTIFSVTSATSQTPDGHDLEHAPSTNILRSADTEAARQYALSGDDEELLNEIQLGCFQYLWNEVGSPAALVKDRGKAKVASMAAVGFQLAALPIGVERGWISRDEGQRRAQTVLEAIVSRNDNRKFGILLHFVDHHTGGNLPDSPDVQFSTVDHALCLAGAVPAAEYFGGRVAAIVQQLIRESNWQAYVRGEEGFVGFGFRPSDPKQPLEAGEFIPYAWKWASAEEQLVYLFAVASPNERHAVEPTVYYRLSRPIRRHGTMPPHVVSWNGALFTYFFSHCFIDFRNLEADDPSQFGTNAPRVDWFENSRRAILTHRQRCIENSQEFSTLAANRWGLSPSLGYLPDGSDTYLVPAIRPNVWDHEEWCGGTIAPYAAGSAIMFTPQESLQVLRELRHLRREGESTLFAWQDTSEGGYGLVDALNLDEGWAVQDHVGIDVGPMLLAIENARTGLIWELFARHECVRRGMQKLAWAQRVPAAEVGPSKTQDT